MPRWKSCAGAPPAAAPAVSAAGSAGSGGGDDDRRQRGHATYNGERFVAEQVRSILSQSRPPDELVVCDDGSTDATLTIVRDLTATSAMRTKVLTATKRLGTVANLERGLHESTGDVVVLADHDDAWHAHRVETAVDRLLAPDGPEALFSDADLVDAGGLALSGSLWDRVRFTPARQAQLAASPLGVLITGNVVTGATLAVRRAAIDRALPMPSPGWHDYWLALVVAGTTGRIEAHAGRLIRYRLHEQNHAGLRSPRALRRLAVAAAAREARGGDINLLHELQRRFSVPPAVQRAAAHLSFRQTLDGPRRTRLLPVLAHVTSGEYRRHGGGWKTGLYDLAAPGRDEG